MKKEENLLRFRSIPDIHAAFGYPKPKHPLVSLTLCEADKFSTSDSTPAYDVLDFYKITFITEQSGRIPYGQGFYDFNDGSMLFLAPNQLVGAVQNTGETNWSKCYVLLIHPHFFMGYPLAKKIKQYGYFSYAVNEALHLSDCEKEIILSVYRIIEQELNSRIDEFSQEVVIAQIELLLSYANRFYKRQFVTRKAVNSNCYKKQKPFWMIISTVGSHCITASLRCSILPNNYTCRQII